MKIYKIERTDGVNYEEYDSAVVVAESPEDAINVIKETNDVDQWESWRDSHPNFPDNVTVKEVELVRGIVVASFNAG